MDKNIDNVLKTGYCIKGVEFQVTYNPMTGVEG